MLQNVKARWEKHVKTWKQFQRQADDILIDYANEFLPIPSMKWFEVDIIYVPINVWIMHWLLKVFHLAQRRIFVYDSLIGISSNNQLKGAIISLAKFLLHIFHNASYYGDNGDPKSDQ